MVSRKWKVSTHSSFSQIGKKPKVDESMLEISIEVSPEMLSTFENFDSYTVNVNSQITDKLRYLSVNSKKIHLFLDIFESCHIHRQMSVKIKIKSHIQQKNWENFVSMKKVS